ncbi:hypothetical protein N9551_00830 [Flavobacteriaceae bacterium]|nr:hypothetical protein [Flavobacteriaceae bacterium]MDB4206531.1 hypothetical protein [Flavobacteriaceae bacterium]
MKPILICFTLIVLLTGCHSKKNARTQNSEKKSIQSEIELLYGAHTRGYFLEISVNKNRLTEFKDYEKLNAISKDLKDGEWNKCMKLLDQINLTSLPTLKSPTNYRQYDGAAFAQLTIIKKGDTIQSNNFDHKYPPSEIKALVEHLLSIQEN